MKKFKKGFTITELVIVIAVIAILAAVLIPTFTSIVKRAEESAALQESTAVFHEKMVDVVLEEDDAKGMVFVNNGYVFANLEGALTKIAEKDQKANVLDENMFKKYDSANTANLAGIATVVTDDTTPATKITLKANDVLYFYTIELDGKNYFGYFTYNEADNVEKTYYSMEFGVSDTQLTVKIA